MAISPSSDLVLDVVRAADPAAADAASARLAAGAPAPLASAAASQTFNATFDRAGNTIPEKAGVAKDVPPSYRKFEAMVLQNFIQSMLPSQSEDVYGSGTAGDIWKSMMAQQIATVVADRGGIGIADHLLEGHLASLGGPAKPQSSASGDDLNRANSLIHQLQMKALDGTAPVGTDDTTNGAL